MVKDLAVMLRWAMGEGAGQTAGAASMKGRTSKGDCCCSLGAGSRTGALRGCTETNTHLVATLAEARGPPRCCGGGAPTWRSPGRRAESSPGWV